jgi:hypothetical protein
MTKRMVVAFLVIGLAACQGVITEPGGGDGAGGESSGGGAGAVDTTKNALLPSPRLVRLSHEQWENTVVDLFGYAEPTGKSESFPADPQTSGFLFDNNGESLQVVQALWTAYQRAAEEVAADVVSSPSRLAALLPADTGDSSARARSFIETFGRRAYRRPLTKAEVDDLMAVYDAAPANNSSTPAFEAGIEQVIAALLQSPFFLYRIESSTKKDASGAIPLSGYEQASRLSFLLTNSMPDDALLDAAEQGKLAKASGVETEARRLLKTPRAEKTVTRFFQAFLDVGKWSKINPLPNQFPDAPSGFADLARQENERFIQYLFSSGAGYREVLTSNETFVNQDLAKLYGLSGSFGESFERVTLDPTERRGVFTQLGFLAANATSVDPDPIHRGAFLARRVACLGLSAPPDGVPPLPPAGDLSNRQNVEAHTEQPGSNCAGCHATMINPLGFPFEHYDAIGKWRTADNGHPIDTATTPLINGEPTPVADALELADEFADSQRTHECYTERWIEYAFNRKGTEQDTGVVRYLAEQSRGGVGMEEMLVQLVTTRAFRSRSPEEMP